MGSGVIYAGIVVAWAAVLIPMWLRRHDEAHEARAGDRASRAVRILTRREERSVAPPAISTQREDPAARPGRARVIARRRRTLLALLLLTVVVTVCAALGMAPSWSPIVPGVATLGYLVHLRAQARHEAELARRRRDARGRSAARSRRVDSAERVVAVRREREAARATVAAADLAAPAATMQAAEQVAEQAAVEQAAAPEAQPPTAAAEESQREEQRRAAEAAAGWEPRSAPLPTYVTKPKASRPARSIDLRASGSWTSAPAPEGAGPEAAAGGATALDAGSGPARGRGDRPVPAATAAFDQSDEDEVVEQRRVVG